MDTLVHEVTKVHAFWQRAVQPEKPGIRRVRTEEDYIENHEQKPCSHHRDTRIGGFAKALGQLCF